MTRKNINLLVSVLFLLISLFFIPSQRIKSPQISPIPLISPTTSVLSATDSANLVKVIRVIDGDTIEIEGGQKIRYIGVNSPESVAPGKKVACFGKESADKNRELVLGKMVKLEKDISETDKYGRLLRYVYAEGSPELLFVNNELVKLGFAQVSTYPPDVKYQNLFLESQKYAKENKLGLWSDCP